jgi:L-histidine N-alpha-methyltransferase
MEEQTFTSQGVAADTRRGLTDNPKWLSSLYFYDKVGSQLFDDICDTPEYYPTRTEAEILEKNVGEILELANPDTIAELGSGASRKTRIVLDAFQGTYVPVDVSKRFLLAVADELSAAYPHLHIDPIPAEYADGLRQIGSRPGKKLVMFLGSSLGNFEPNEQDALMRTAHNSLQPGDAFLLGTDLVKDPAIIRAAYNDAAGKTAAFNLNILTNLNGKIGGDVDPAKFEHKAIWSEEKSRIEMHLRSTVDQTITFTEADLAVALAAGETIHTENSYKFTPERIAELANGTGFTHERTWTDEKGWYGLHLLRA